ncbi:type VII secretion protein EccCa [Streptomyces sp. NBC_00669]|uniref:type VII secretion protein EccCa n=1 Tax=Streptomyces sp. NBC_00669 TaxID=2976011 RepID=UPI003FA7623B
MKRSPRRDGPPMPDGQVELAEPPVLGEPAGVDFGSALLYLPMGLGAGAMVLMFSVRSMGPTTYMMSGMMGVAMISMTLTQVGRSSSERRRRMKAERRDYLRYLAQRRRQARTAAAEQRAALLWDNPDPRALWAFAMGPRLWERRPSHEDFGRVRIGMGIRRAELVFLPPQTKPVEDLEPLTAISLRRFTKAHQTVPDLPIPVALRRFTRVEFAGDGQEALALMRAMVAQLAVLHAPDELRVAVLGNPAARAEWDWVKWLPHNAHPDEQDDAGALRLAAGDHDELMALLGPEVRDRPDHDPDASPNVTEPYLVVIAQGAHLPDGSRLLGEGMRNTLLLDATGALRGGDDVLRLTVRDGTVSFPAGDDASASATADALSATAAETLARGLAPLRTGGSVDLTERPLESDFDLTSLLSIRDPRTFDVAAKWRPRQTQSARLRVPLGVTDEGEVVELDLKESAQGGMGPHGLLIGATGSGKSELLRTLVMGLAATHSSEVLNLVLVDFKGGATFLNMDRLPHTSAVITNLADEIHLVDRMRDSINGEMIRRQELLRESGHSSLFDYEKARVAGATLAPLPSLLIIVDEFSELLASKPEFVDLFVSVGRLGRSLGVHLLLASQRLDESRIHKVEGHLSYRLALRTFSSMESRSVIGVSHAYELPSAPGNGYLKVDTTNLVRFKAAYVSGPAPEPAAENDPAQQQRAAQEVTVFGLDRSGELLSARAEETAALAEAARAAQAARGAAATTGPDGEPLSEESLLEVLVGRLEDAGPPARQVWLPPLDSSVSLDQVLPAIVPDPDRGMSAADYPRLASLRFPLGMVDKPYEQSRDLLTADLSGADGHIGLVGAPRTGKSTMLRTLMLSLALTHTPQEIQFYCLDFGGGGLVSTAGLPHVGSVATRLDRDRVQRTVAELTQLLERREAEFGARGLESMAGYRAQRATGELDDPYGDVFLVVDGWGTLRQDYEDIEPRVIDLAARGLSFGIHVIGSAVRWSEFRPRLRDLLGTKFELRLGDTLESEVGARAAAAVPHQPGRGLTSAGHHFLAALPRLDSSPHTEDLTAATKEAVAEIDTFWTGRPAPGVRLLPGRLSTAQLPPAEGDLRVCLGWDEQRLEPAWHDFSVNPHLMVFGDNETGKTNMLRLMVAAITSRYTPEEARIMVADPGRGLLTAVPEAYRVGYVVDSDALGQLAASAAVSVGKRVPGADISPENLARRDWWSGPLLFVLIDDFDLFSGAPGSPSPMTPLVPLLAQAPHIGLHLVLSRSTSGAMRAMMDPVLRRLWELGNPALLFSYPKEEGKFIGEAKPRTLPPGRAQLVTRRSVKLMQTGLVAAE